MKSIINGKKYDTETATLICSYKYSNNGDFRHVLEELYQKKTGEFFLYAEGGPNSKYGHKTGQNVLSGNILIIPLSDDEARSFVEKNGSVEQYEQLFGEVSE